MYFHIVDFLPEETWRPFVENHKMGNIFHTPEMFNVFRRAKCHTPHVWGIIDDNGEVQALLPLVEVSVGNGVPRTLTTRAIAYGGVLASAGAAGNKWLSFLLENYIHTSAKQTLFTELRHLSDMSSYSQMLAQNGFTHEDHQDYLIDINLSPDQILQNIGSRTRKHIRSGLRKGNVIIETIVQKEHLIDWYKLIQKTYSSARVPLADFSLFEAAFDVLQEPGMIKFWLARIGDLCVAASVELLYKDVMYGWYGGVDRAFTREVPGELIMWHILKWGAENGYHLYDFGGAGKPNQEYGVRDFKSKFGGNLVCYGRDTFIPNRILMNVSTLGYKIYQKIF